MESLRRRRLVAALTALLLAGCGEAEVEIRFGTGPGHCPPMSTPSIRAEARDALTGAAVRLRAGRVESTAPRYADGSVPPGPPFRFDTRLESNRFTLMDLIGTFDLVLEADGYRPFVLEDITVQSDGCVPQTVRVVAAMVRA